MRGHNKGGRKRQPDWLKQLRGNPHGHKLFLDGEMSVPAVSPVAAKEPPDFLTGTRERQLYQRILDDRLLGRIVRRTDVAVLARYCFYLATWLSYREVEAQGARPSIYRCMLDLERILVQLEDRIGLN